MKLLIATDHAFLRCGTEVYDNYCFDRGFFEDYRSLFDVVEVISRIENVTSLPDGAMRSDGNGICFVGVENVRKAKWFLRARALSKAALTEAMDRVDAVVVRVPSQLGLYAAKLALKKKKPYMIEVIGDPKETWLSSGKEARYQIIARLEAHRLRQLARQADAGSYVSRHLSTIYPLSSGNPYEIISSIRLDDNDIASPREYSEETGTLKVVHVGRLEPRKRCQDLIRASHKALDRGIELRVHFAGDGPDRSKLQALCKELRIEERVVFHGHIADRKSLNNLLDSSDLFIMTSASEGLPRAMIEAMARGLPLLGAKTPGVDELAHETDLFPVGDTGSLADLIAMIVNDRHRLTKMSKHSVETATQYTSAVLSPKRQNLYRFLLKEAARV